MNRLTVGLFGGPGGWAEAARQLGIPETGVEWDDAACQTRRAAGHETIQADVAAFDVTSLRELAAEVWGLIGSPPCKLYSAAGTGIGRLVIDVLAAAIPRMLAGEDCREEVRQRIYPVALEVRQAENEAREPAKRWTAERVETAARGDAFEAALVLEPARFIHACHPEWVALEQVPAVLPLWEIYVAELRKMSYSVWAGTLNSADYGVPQTRIRAILIASRARRVARPEPTHYDARKGGQLWNTPWVSMADALGWGATVRPVPTVTAGGTSTGGAEPFGHRGRDALTAEQEAGQWALRAGNQPNAAVRPAPAPAPAMVFGHNAARMEWVLNPNASGHMRGYTRGIDQPAPGLTGQVDRWSLHRSRGASVDRRDHPADEPAPTITGAGGKAGGNLTWKFRNNNNNACERSLDEPAGTLFFGQRSNWAAWVAERPATTVQGDPRVGRPGHKDRDKGESQFAQDSVRITVEEAAALQSFPPGYPWQGSKTARFRQCGDAVPPLLAIPILGVAAGINWLPIAERYSEAVYGRREARVMMRDYVCGKCGEEFGSNCEEDVSCPECEARICEHCGLWTGGLD